MKRLDLEDVKKEFKEAGRVLLATEYINAHTKMPHICICGRKHELTLSHLRKGRSCGCKRKVSKKYTLEDIQRLFSNEGCTLLAKEFTSVNNKVPYICVCGNESEIKISHFKNGVRCQLCKGKKNQGENNHRWNPNLTDEQRELNSLSRSSIKEHRTWSRKVLKRDDFTCQCCGVRGGVTLNAHHILNFISNKDLRFDINNGITFCESCHIRFHVTYGYKDNNKKQVDEFIKKNNKSAS